jgi:RNA recognition motif-containing protein
MLFTLALLNSQSSFGFVDYYDRRYAALAIVSLNGRQLFGQPIKVNWAYTSTQREDTSGFELKDGLNVPLFLILLYSVCASSCI